MNYARIKAAYEIVRGDLLAEREEAGHWVGELSNSALSTATAVSALSIFERRMLVADSEFAESERGRRISDLVVGGLRWLADHQNDDGGWGDTDRSHSNIATTMLAVAAFHLVGVPADHADLLERAEKYIKSQGGIAGLRKRYGADKTFAVPILTNYALADLAPWSEVSPLPFELACFPQSLYRFLQIPVVSYAIPALVAIGQARYFHAKPLNPIARLARWLAVGKSRKVLRKMQPESGGYLEATPLTSFVVMSLASIELERHAVTRSGVQFLLDSVRPDGSWPIDTNLATWNTTLAVQALAAGGENVVRLDCLDWLLSCQHRRRHPFTGAAPGGWGWSDLSGAVPDADDTPGALLALHAWRRSPSCTDRQRAKIRAAASLGVRWLLKLQNRDGGWPTFCRGWGKLPFDRSGADLTAHAIRALHVWRGDMHSRRIADAVRRGFLYLERVQRPDGSWVPLWFGNQDHPEEENPVYGTSKVLLAYAATGQTHLPSARLALEWLYTAQNDDGGWGGGSSQSYSAKNDGVPADDNSTSDAGEPTSAAGSPVRSSVEETALAVDAIFAASAHAGSDSAIIRGLEWLVAAVDAGRHKESSPIGFYFAKLWYYERLYPLTFTTAALGRALHSTAFYEDTGEPVAADSRLSSDS